MRLTSIKPGDLVRVDDGLKPWYGKVLQITPQSVQVQRLDRPLVVGTVKARDVTGIWHASKRTEPFKDYLRP